MFTEIMHRKLNKERSGSSIFEWTMTLPFALVVVLTMFYIMLVILSWASYGSVASTIAKDLNMRSIGLIEANERAGATNQVQIKGTNGKILATINRSDITINGGTPSGKIATAYQNAVLLHLKEHTSQFTFPYTKFKNMNVSIKQNNGNSYVNVFNPSGALSNYLVKVDLRYDFVPFQVGLGESVVIPALPLTAVGYGIVT